MELLRLSRDARGAPRACALAVGNFDGVHRGHQALVKAAVSEGGRLGVPAAVLTFFPHPARVVAPHRAPAALMTLQQKAEVLQALGVDVVIVLEFDEASAAQSAEDFAARLLAGALQARAVVVGESFRFGHKRGGDLALLRALGPALGFTVLGVPPVVLDGTPVSSSRVRDAVSAGDVAGAAALLGRPHFLDGIVVRGEGRGRALGVPTANLAPEAQLLPGLGVYACHVQAGAPLGPPLPAVVNVGARPTFGGGALSVEAHILDTSPQLYDAPLRVHFRSRLRGEQRFSGAEALVAQIKDDIARARPLLSRPLTDGL